MGMPLVVMPTVVSSGNAFAKDLTVAPRETLLVVVRKRAEPEKSVPAVIQTFRASEINTMRLQSPTDISSQVSGFSFNDPFGRYNPAPSMRGLIQPGLGDEGDGLAVRRLQRRDAGDRLRGVALQLPPQRRNDLTQGN